MRGRMPAGAGSDGERVLALDDGRSLFIIEDLDRVFLIDHSFVRNGPHEADLLPMGAVRREKMTMRPYPGSLAAMTSTFSITGGCASSSDAFAISAAATRPERWA